MKTDQKSGYEDSWAGETTTNQQTVDFMKGHASMATLQTSTSLPIATTKPGIGTSTAATMDILADMQLVTHLFDLGQVLCQKMQGGVTDLCHDVKQLTQGRAHLHLECEMLPRWQQFPPGTLITIPIQFGHVSYGTLCITCDPIDTKSPSISLPVAQLLAQACSWLLHTFEQSTFLHVQCQQFEYQVQGPLTKREQEVLQLIYRSYNREEIANQLGIAPATIRKHRQHIYEQLGVHNERDALLAAYYSGLLSPFVENLS